MNESISNTLQDCTNRVQFLSTVFDKCDEGCTLDLTDCIGLSSILREMSDRICAAAEEVEKMEKTIEGKTHEN